MANVYFLEETDNESFTNGSFRVGFNGHHYCISPGKREEHYCHGAWLQKGQTSEKKLSFVIPNDWIIDKGAADKAGGYAVLLPKGKNLENTDKAITIAFQKKDPNTPGLENITNFFRVDMENTMSQFPDMQAARWQPSGLNPDTLTFMSIEIWGKKKDQPSPHHVLITDAGDGYFSITVSAENMKDLHQAQFEDFFNSIKLQ